MGRLVTPDSWRAAEAEKIRMLAAERLGAWSSLTDKIDGSLAVMECFPVFEAQVDLLLSGTEQEVIDGLRFTGRWHLQVSLDARPFGFARVVESTHELGVERWSRDDLCARLDNAIASADAAMTADDAVAVLVEVPSLGLSALVVFSDGSHPWAWVLRLGRSRHALTGQSGSLVNLLYEARRLRPLVGVTDA